MPFQINKPSSSVIEQTVPENCQIEPVQANADECKVEPVQTDASQLFVTATQATASNLNAQVTSIGVEVRRTYTVAPTIVSLSSVTARSAQLTAGQYAVISSIDVYFLQGGGSVDATTSSHWIPAGLEIPLYITGTSDDYIAGITDGGTGKLFISKID